MKRGSWRRLQRQAQRPEGRSQGALRQKEEQWRHQLRRLELENAQLRERMAAQRRPDDARERRHGAAEAQLPFLDHVLPTAGAKMQQADDHPALRAMQAALDDLILQNQKLSASFRENTSIKKN